MVSLVNLCSRAINTSPPLTPRPPRPSMSVGRRGGGRTIGRESERRGQTPTSNSPRTPASRPSFEDPGSSFDSSFRGPAGETEIREGTVVVEGRWGRRLGRVGRVGVLLPREEGLGTGRTQIPTSPEFPILGIPLFGWNGCDRMDRHMCGPECE